MSEPKTKRKVKGFVAAGLYGSVITGVLGWYAALAAFFGGSWPAVGWCLIASALAFGLLANSLLRE